VTRLPPYVAVVGSGDTGAFDATAYDVGRALGAAGAVLVTGGLGGVMAAACRGAVEAGGLTVGLLPGTDRFAANPHVTVALPTGLGEARNALVVRAADVVIAVGGEWGTLSEIALALKTGTPVVGISTWELRRDGQVVPGVREASDAETAVELALALAPVTPNR
jgi:uncharacterized protein (TIGR00725 family)